MKTRQANDAELRNNDHYESDEETEDGRGTPRGPSRQDEPNNSHRLSTSSATSELTSSFVSSVQAASPHLSDTSVLDDTDTRMLEQLFESLGNVCTELQSVTSKGDDEKTIRVLRRRLDAARRALEGELDA